MSRKPPLGIEPKYFWMRERADHLTEVIRDYIREGIITPTIEWTKELYSLLVQLDKE